MPTVIQLGKFTDYLVTINVKKSCVRLQIKILSMIKQKKRKLGKKLIADCRENLVLTRMNRIASTYSRTKVCNHLKFLIFLGSKHVPWANAYLP